MGGLFLEEFFGTNSLFYFNVERIDLFVKILVFIRILSKSRRRKEGRILILRSAIASTSHLKKLVRSLTILLPRFLDDDSLGLHEIDAVPCKCE